jgi:hypothetical protein
MADWVAVIPSLGAAASLPLQRLEELDAGAVKTILFLVQPETLTSTRIYTRMLLRGIGGVARTRPAETTVTWHGVEEQVTFLR